MRPMAPIIAVLLAITMAIFPIAMPRAAASADHRSTVTLDTHHSHGEADVSCARASVTCGDHEGDGHEASGSGCCGMSVCHAFQVSAAPAILCRHVTMTSVTVARDEQVGGVTPGGLDKPPRTI